MVGVVDVVMECGGLHYRPAADTDSNSGGGVDQDSNLLYLRGLGGLGRLLKEGLDNLRFLLPLTRQFSSSSIVVIVSGRCLFARVIPNGNTINHLGVFVDRARLVGRGRIWVLRGSVIQ